MRTFPRNYSISRFSQDLGTLTLVWDFPDPHKPSPGHPGVLGGSPGQGRVQDRAPAPARRGPGGQPSWNGPAIWPSDRPFPSGPPGPAQLQLAAGMGSGTCSGTSMVPPLPGEVSWDPWVHWGCFPAVRGSRGTPWDSKSLKKRKLLFLFSLNKNKTIYYSSFSGS